MAIGKFAIKYLILFALTFKQLFMEVFLFTLVLRISSNGKYKCNEFSSLAIMMKLNTFSKWGNKSDDDEDCIYFFCNAGQNLEGCNFDETIAMETRE